MKTYEEYLKENAQALTVLTQEAWSKLSRIGGNQDGIVEYGWLVEGSSAGRAVWLGITESGTIWWSFDSNLAVRFARAEDGKAMVNFLSRDMPPGTATSLLVTAHEWV